MAVLPESTNKIDVKDTEKSLSTLENYIRYMGERIEFAMRNVTRNVSDAGVSSAEMYVLLVAVQNSVSTLSSELNALKSTVNTMQGTLNTATENITALDERVTALESK